MNCGGARRLFGACWDDEITLAERDWLEAHFASCRTCRESYEAFTRTIELVGSLPPPRCGRTSARMPTPA